MKPTEHPARIPFLRTGLFAALRGLLRVKGSATSSAPRCTLVTLLVLATTLGALAFTAASALAAAPETPGLTVEQPVHATEAVLHGTLNPVVEGETGTYRFLYKPGGSCEGGSETPSGLALGGKPETLPAELLSGLAANTEYAVCLLDEVSPTEKALSTPVSFKTALPPETPVTEAASGETITTANLHGTLDPKATGNPGTYEFLYRESSTECQGEGQKEVGAGVMTGGKAQVVEFPLTGLLPHGTYTYCLLARNEAGETAVGPPVTFTTLAIKPTLSAQEATGLTATSATLTAGVNPNGSEVTTCQFEYGTEAGVYPNKVACSPQPGSGQAVVAVSAHTEALSANQTYHWRLAATSAAGTTTSPDHTFIYPTTGAELPDHRAYEMVSPPFKGGSEIGITAGGSPPLVSADGSHLIAMDIQCFAPSESCNEEDKSGEPFEFTRTPAGWVTTALAPPATQFSETIAWLASPDAGTALFSMSATLGGARHWYAREPNGAFVDIGPATPPGHSDIKSFDEGPWASTSDLSHLVWRQFEESGFVELWPFDGTTGTSSLYEYVGASNPQPFMVAVTGERASTELLSTCGAMLGLGKGQNLNPVSADGRTVYFTVEACPGGTGANAGREVPVGELYARINGEEPDVEGSLRKPETVAISEPQALAPGPRTECESTPCIENTSTANETTAWREATFLGASTGGSKAFFTSAQQLTDTAVEGSTNLYEFECPDHCEDQASGHLTDLSSGSPSPAVAGVLAISADGSHIYFIARGKLASNASALGTEAVPGQDNLYVSANGHVAFIATLPEAENRSWIHQNTANVTPDGRFLVFESGRDLTPDDTRTDGAVQIFRYNADTAQLLRISAGDRGFNDNGNSGTGNATIPEAGVSDERLGPARADPTMSENGEYVFFSSPIALTPHALNDVPIGPGLARNVYEWHDGSVYLISDGKDTAVGTSFPCGAEERSEVSAVCLLGTDSSGHNVFFTTADRLVRSDTDTQTDIYDARICEPEHGNPCITEPPAPVPPCGGEACHGSPAATPSLLAPGTASFNGEGNISPPPPTVVKPKPLTTAQKLAKALRACRAKHNKHTRSVCERAAHKKYASKARAKKAKRATSATNHRRGGR